MADLYTFDERGMRKLADAFHAQKNEMSNLKRLLTHLSTRRHEAVYMPGKGGYIVEVRHDSSTDGYLVAANAEGLHKGIVRSTTDGITYTEGEVCWIQFTMGFSGYNDDAGDVVAVQGEWYGPAIKSGSATSGGNTYPLYICDCPEREFIGVAESQIGIATSGTVNLYHSTTRADSSITKEAYALGATIFPDLWVIVSRVAGVWIVSPLQCPNDVDSEY